MGGYVKITFEDIEIAKNFFENEKHLDEFLVNVCKYYCGYENVFKYKNVKKFFETYKKTMDRVILGRSTGSIGGKKRVENQQDTTNTLEGVLEGGVKDPVQPKEIKEINLTKEIEIKENKENVNYNRVFEFFKLTTKKQIRLFTDKAKGQLRQRLSEGFSYEDIEIAIKNCFSNKWHIDNNHKDLTLEFILRADKLEKYLLANNISEKPQVKHNYNSLHGITSN